MQVAISKEFLWDTLSSVVAELERVDPQSVVGARARGLLDGKSMMLASQSDRHPRPPKAERDDKIAQAYLGGSSISVIAGEIGVTPDTVRNALIRRGVTRRKSGECQKTTASRRDDGKRQRIKAMREAGKTLTEIGLAEQISRERVRQILAADGITGQRPLSPDEHAAVAEYLAGGSVCEVSERHSMAATKLRKLVLQSGHEMRPSRRNGGHQPDTLKKAERAAQLYAEGRTIRDIQDELNVNYGTGVYRLLAIAGVTIRLRQHERKAA